MRVRQLTNDRFADMQPAWSPDGRSLAFVTDRASEPGFGGAGSDFERLRYSRLRLAMIDVASGEIRVLRGLPNAKHINPQYSRGREVAVLRVGRRRLHRHLPRGDRDGRDASA